MNISGTQCTLDTDHAAGELGFTNNGTMQRSKQDKIAIIKIVGYRKQVSIDQVPTKTVEIEAGCTLYYYGDNTVEISVYDMLMRGVNTWNLGTLDKPPHHKVCMALCAADGDHTGVLWVNEQGGVVCKHNNNGAYHYSGNVRFPLIKTT